MNGSQFLYFMVTGSCFVSIIIQCREPNFLENRFIIFSLTDLLFKPSQKIVTARHNPPRILEASFARVSMSGKHGATMVQLN